MGVRLSIHANGGYDVVNFDETNLEEGDYLEFVSYSLDPITLFEIEKKFTAAGAVISDYRSIHKIALACAARAAVAAARELIEYAYTHVGVEPEAIAKAKLYANECLKLATEECC
jgi:hypothetical protein